VTEPEALPPPRRSRARRYAAFAAFGAAALVTLIASMASPAAPWWMYPFLFCVVAIVVFRLLRPMKRRPGWEDEL
jgi:membrane protein implicated in regulation of membrane protease activity